MQSKFIRLLGSSSVVTIFGLFAVTLPACSNIGADNGTLVVTWTIASTSDASLCDKYDGWVVVQVTDSSGYHYSSSNAPCNSFATAFGNIPVGIYGLSAYMFDANDDTTLSTVSPGNVSVNTGSTTTDSINFSITASN